MDAKQVIEKTSGIGLKEKIGYAMGDVGCVMSFGLIGSLLQKYYTDVLLIPAGAITILFLVARLWDAINDPLWGRIIDTRKPNKYGRYRRWMVIASVPLGLSTILLFFKIPGLTPSQYLIYAYFTYIIYGMLFTGANIPYGSLASVITTDEKERSALSIFRSVGAGVGGIPAMLLAGLIFITVTVDGESASIIKYERLIAGVVGISVFSVFFYYLCFKWTKERVVPIAVPTRERKANKRVIINLLKSKPLIMLCIASMFLITSQLFVQSFYLYIFADYFGKPNLYIFVTVCTYAPTVVLMFFATKITSKLGKKEVCAAGALLSAVSNLVLFLLQTSNPYIFLIFSAISGIGLTFFLLLIWALVTDAIDYYQCKTGIKEDATCYAFFSFTRKIGHTLAGVLATQALVWIGYKGEALLQSAMTVKQMYNVGVIIPAVLFFAIFITLWFFYPLSKKKLKELQTEKAKLLEKELAQSE